MSIDFSSGLASLLKGTKAVSLVLAGQETKLTFRKLVFSDYAAIEQAILSKRVDTTSAVKQILEKIAELPDEQKDIRNVLVEAAKEAINQLMRLSRFAVSDEIDAFRDSDYGRAFVLHLAASISLEEATVLIGMNDPRVTLPLMDGVAFSMDSEAIKN